MNNSLPWTGTIMASNSLSWTGTLNRLNTLSDVLWTATPKEGDITLSWTGIPNKDDIVNWYTKTLSSWVKSARTALSPMVIEL
ncbi:hypothetical protein GCM10009114_13900 [Aliiglaciecola litoralis]|uniref:Uncharacterized protein n=1 Tax=Aliiglaciecola litoralis TaxID=582857 RepID=A0ABN1LFM6_9ALTE